MVFKRTTLGTNRVALNSCLIVLVAIVGAAVGACRGGKTVDPETCMRQCDQDCPYTPGGVGDNDEYLECLEACQGRCN